jgi:signal transduction histidine kinase
MGRDDRAFSGAQVHARRWLWLFVACRVAAAVVAAGLLSLQSFSGDDPLLGGLALAWAALTVGMASRRPELMRSPVAWALDAVVWLALVAAGGEWRSAFYLAAITSLIAPATALALRPALAVGAGFALAYLLLAVVMGVDWDALGSTPRLESFATHLLVPVLVVVALAHSARALAQLDGAHERSEALALEGERRRLAWELHDSAKQRIHAAQLVISSLDAADPVSSSRLELVSSELAGAVADLEASLTELRTTLGGRRLEEAIARRAAELEIASGIPITVEGSAPPLPTFAAVHAYRVACEALSNAVRHSAASRIAVTLTADDHRLRLLVADDGRGISGGEDSHGMRSMRDRARTLGGRLLISTAHRQGTRVELEMPIALPR